MKLLFAIFALLACVPGIGKADLIITQPAVALHVAAGKSLTISNTLTLTGTDGAIINLSALTPFDPSATKLSAFAATSSAELATVLSDETGDGGGFVRANNATLVAPTLGAATATSLSVGSTPLSISSTGVITLQNTTIGTTTVSSNYIAGSVGGGMFPQSFGRSCWKSPSNGILAAKNNDETTDSGITCGSLTIGGGTLGTGSKLNIASIPTSSSGLNSGDVWSNLGVLTIVP